MFELIDYKPEHAIEVVAGRIRQPNLKYCDKETKSWSAALAEFPAKTGLWDSKIIGCGGLIILTEKHRAEAWILIVSNINDYPAKRAHRAVRNQLYDWILEYELVRIEAPLRADFEAGFGYARYMGFRFEAILKKYHPDNVDAHMHVIVMSS